MTGMYFGPQYKGFIKGRSQYMLCGLGYVREGKNSCCPFMNPSEAYADSGQTTTHPHHSM